MKAKSFTKWFILRYSSSILEERHNITKTHLKYLPSHLIKHKIIKNKKMNPFYQIVEWDRDNKNWRKRKSKRKKKIEENLTRDGKEDIVFNGDDPHP